MKLQFGDLVGDGCSTRSSGITSMLGAARGDKLHGEGDAVVVVMADGLGDGDGLSVDTESSMGLVAGLGCACRHGNHAHYGQPPQQAAAAESSSNHVRWWVQGPKLVRWCGLGLNRHKPGGFDSHCQPPAPPLRIPGHEV